PCSCSGSRSVSSPAASSVAWGRSSPSCSRPTFAGPAKASATTSAGGSERCSPASSGSSPPRCRWGERSASSPPPPMRCCSARPCCCRRPAAGSWLRLRELQKLCAGAVLFSMPNAEALALAAALAADPPDGFLDAVPGAWTLLLLYDPDLLDPTELRLPAPSEAPRPRVVRLKARYDGADLEEVARELGISRDEAVRRHVQAEHVVSFLGFAPGFAYITGGFSLPRLSTPRVRVPAGSLAIADGYTGIYPAETPGGWRLLGHVAARMFDPGAGPPALLRPRDRVGFEPLERPGEVPPPPPAPPDRGTTPLPG